MKEILGSPMPWYLILNGFISKYDFEHYFYHIDCYYKPTQYDTNSIFVRRGIWNIIRISKTICSSCKKLNVNEYYSIIQIKIPKMENHCNISCPDDVIAGYLITKDKRHEIFGQVAGGAGSMNPEKYQRKKIIEGTGIDCPKTCIRVHYRTNTLQDKPHPNKYSNGFDYSEDFDGIQCINDKTVFINLKCIVGKGGNQTRSSREVHRHIDGQLNILQIIGNENIYFANIIDGDEGQFNMSKFNNLYTHIPSELVENLKKHMYIGDLMGYFDWFKHSLFCDK